MSDTVDETAAAIRGRIVSGVWAPGDRLVERTLAAELDVSRVPVREALRQLVAEGFASVRTTGGVSVRRYSDAEVAELVEANRELERLIVMRLARSRDAARLAVLEAAIAVTERALARGRPGAAVAANAAFHEALVRAGEGYIAAELAATLGPRIAWLMRQHAEPAPIHAEHRALVEAIAAGDARRAGRLARAHAATTLAAQDAQ
ncbi:GntR family transcriptional regulator [Jatrophihabitans fulvus]